MKRHNKDMSEEEENLIDFCNIKYVSASTDLDNVKSQIEQNGFAVIDGILSEDKCKELREKGENYPKVLIYIKI